MWQYLIDKAYETRHTVDRQREIYFRCDKLGKVTQLVIANGINVEADE